MHVLVTGGAGFIGSRLIKMLRKQSHDVDAIDNHSNSPAVSKRREKDLEHDKEVEVWDIDIKDTNTVLKYLKKRKDLKEQDQTPAVDAIVHLAAPISVAESMNNAQKYCDEIHRGTISVLEAAKMYSIKKVILASTAAVYGNTERLPVTEHVKTDPQSPYAISKLAAEGIARMYSREHGIETVILRFFNVYGPDQDPSSGYSGVISKFMLQAKEKKPFIIFGDGKQTRDLIYVDDIVLAVTSAIEKHVEPGIVINVGSGKETSILDLAQATAKVAGVPYKVEHKEPRKGDILRSEAAIDRAKSKLGFEPKTSLEEGLKQTWDWFKDYKG
jgi:nucleoside-diphosphate-sugar epimerase